MVHNTLKCYLFLQKQQIAYRYIPVSNLLPGCHCMDLFFILFSYFFSTQSLSKEKVRTPYMCCWSEYSPLI